jgi:hypothetical protein
MLISVAAARAAVVSLVGALAMPAAAASTSKFYDTTRIVGYTKNECVGASGNCRTIKSVKRQIKSGQSKIISLSCPASHPHVAGWDARYHEHISLTFLSGATGADLASSSGSAASAFSSIEVAALNNADAPGHVVLFLGCARKPFVGGSFATSHGAVPSNHPDPASRQR